MKKRNARIKHYSRKHEILLVGEGDFSFAACLAKAFGNASNMTATSLDTEEMLRIKYRCSAMANLDVLEEKGCTILHNIDACTMRRHRILKHKRFDRIVYNFPHAGFFAAEHDSYQIALHQSLVRGFLRNAYEIVAEKGEVHITHKTAHPFCKWEIEELGKEAGFVLIESAIFCIWDYPGYKNRKVSGNHSNQSFPVGDCRTYKFAKT